MAVLNGMKYLGLCILLASFILAGAIIWQAQAVRDVGRYQIQAWYSDTGNLYYIYILDTQTGEG